MTVTQPASAAEAPPAGRSYADHTWQAAYQLPLAGACLVGLAVFGWLGWSVRYVADDFCTAGVVRANGFLDAQAYWYTTWSGRYTFTGLVSALELLGPVMARVMPLLVLAGLLLASYWALGQVAAWTGTRLSGPDRLVLAGTFALAIAVGAPDPFQSVLWQTGNLTYLLPLALGVALAGWSARLLITAADIRLACLSVGCGTFVLAGFNETDPLALAAVCGMAGVYGGLGLRGESRWRALGMGLTGALMALVGLAIIQHAPGNASRGTSALSVQRALAALPLAIQGVGDFLHTTQYLARGELILAVAAPFLVGLRLGPPVHLSGRRTVEIVAVGAVILGLVLVLSWFPSNYALGAQPPQRAQLGGYAALVVWLMLAAFLGGRYGARLAPRPARVVAVGFTLALTLLPLGMAIQLGGWQPAEAAYARQWDAADQSIRQAAQLNPSGSPVAVPALPPHWGMDYVGSAPTDWLNGCVARYYDVAAVTVVGAQSQ